jgi:hypothetical protein
MKSKIEGAAPPEAEYIKQVLITAGGCGHATNTKKLATGL